MDKFQNVPYTNQAHTVPPYNSNPRPAIYSNMVAHVFTDQQQALIGEEFRSILVNLYTQGESYLNQVLNMLFANNCGNPDYQRGVADYLAYSATALKVYPAIYGKDQMLHSLMARAALYRMPDVERYLTGVLNNPNTDHGSREWINGQIMELKTTQVIVEVTRITRASIAARTNGGAPGQGMGAGMIGAGISNNTTQPQYGGMPHHGGMQQPQYGGMQQQPQYGGIQQHGNNFGTSPSRNTLGQMMNDDDVGFSTKPVSHPQNNSFNQPMMTQANNTVDVGVPMTMAPYGPTANKPVTEAPKESFNQANRQHAVTRESVVPQSSVAESSPVKRSGHTLLCEVTNPAFRGMVAGQYTMLGGWSVNPGELICTKDEYTKFKSFHWETKYGVITDETKITPITFSDYEEVLSELDADEEDQLLTLEEDYPELDTSEPLSPDYNRYIELLEAHTQTRNEIMSINALGVFAGVDDTLNVNTKPWGRFSSILEAADKIFTRDVLSEFPDQLHVAIIHGREYLLFDSSDPYVNAMVKTKRAEFGNNWNGEDNISNPGHYYLINHYLDDGMKPVIEDFYDKEEFMDASIYKMRAPAPKFKEDDVDDGVNLSSLDIEPSVLLHDTKISLTSGTPVELAEAMRCNANLNGLTRWDETILTGRTKSLAFLVTANDKDRKAFDKLQSDLDDGKILTLIDLAKWLRINSENNSLSRRLMRSIDSRIMKELNVIFNDMLHVRGLIIERSFTQECNELISVIEDSDTPTLVKVAFRRAESFIINRTLRSIKVSGKVADYFKATTSYDVKSSESGDTVVLGPDKNLPVKDAVRAFSDAAIVYAIPLTMMDIGLNPHSGNLSTTWNCIPKTLMDEVRKNFTTAFGSEKVVIVTRDNYVLTVSGCNSDSLIGTVSIAV